MRFIAFYCVINLVCGLFQLYVLPVDITQIHVLLGNTEISQQQWSCRSEIISRNFFTEKISVINFLLNKRWLYRRSILQTMPRLHSYYSSKSAIIPTKNWKPKWNLSFQLVVKLQAKKPLLSWTIHLYGVICVYVFVREK